MSAPWRRTNPAARVSARLAHRGREPVLDDLVVGERDLDDVGQAGGAADEVDGDVFAGASKSPA
jgi:hypothetical protein